MFNVVIPVEKKTSRLTADDSSAIDQAKTPKLCDSSDGPKDETDFDPTTPDSGITPRSVLSSIDQIRFQRLWVKYILLVLIFLFFQETLYLPISLEFILFFV